MTKLSAYPNERLTEPNNDDYVDVSIEISPGVYQSQKMKWSVVKAAFGGAISENIIAIGNSAGDGITECKRDKCKYKNIPPGKKYEFPTVLLIHYRFSECSSIVVMETSVFRKKIVASP